MLGMLLIQALNVFSEIGPNLREDFDASPSAHSIAAILGIVISPIALINDGPQLWDCIVSH